MSVFFDSRFFEKPINWETHRATIQGKRLVATKMELASSCFSNGFREFVDDPTFLPSLMTLETRQMNLLRFNLIKLQKTDSDPSAQDSGLLRMIGIIENVIKERIGRLPKSYPMPVPDCSPKLRAIYDQCADVFEAFIESHTVCFHAQSPDFIPFQYLLKMIEKLENPGTNFRNRVIFRDYRQPEPFLTVEQYAPDSETDDTEPARSESVLSVDLCSANMERCESAFYYLNLAESSSDSTMVLKKPLKRLLSSFQIEIDQQKKIVQKIRAIQEWLKEHSGGCGNMVMICLPKEIACAKNSPLWISGPNGWLYQENSPREHILDLLQQGHVIESRKHLKIKTDGFWGGDLSIQGRIMTHATRKKEILSFQRNAIPHAIMRECKERVEEIARELISAGRPRS